LAKKPIVLKNGTKLSKDKTKQVYQVVLSSVQNLINQIGNIPEPVHPNYKRFVSRLVKFLENEKKILSLTNKVANNKKFLKLMEMESFNGESATEMMDIIQDGILESFTQETINNMDLSEQTIERMTTEDNEDPIVGLLMYVLLGVMIYVTMKYNRS
jgi:TPP-dependent indolepyruvate ferredoxin oxidoreductase alpha subunit